jgi:hypothetical protein
VKRSSGSPYRRSISFSRFTGRAERYRFERVMTLDPNRKRAGDLELGPADEEEEERAEEDVRVAGGLCRLDAPTAPPQDDR